MPIREDHDYSHIDVPWFLGDVGDLEDYNQELSKAPGGFHPQLARLYLEYIQLGLTDRQACLEVPMSEKWARSWGRGNRDAPDNYVNALTKFAKPLQFDVMANDVVDISDGTDALAEARIIASVHNPLRDALNKSPSKDIKQYSKMVTDRVSSRKWYVSKMKPSQYGDKVQIDHGNTSGKPFKTLDFNSLSDDQLEKLLDLDNEMNDDNST
jgi:hypothetical protein